MNTPFEHLMNEAARLTRGGGLQDATAAIQAALGGMGQLGAMGMPFAPGAEAAATTSPERNVIDVVARDVTAPEGPNSPSPSPSPSVSVSKASSTSASAGFAGQFVAGTYTDAAGSRDYKLYIPPMAGTAGAGPLSLVVMLHGCTQNPDDFAAGTGMNEAALTQGFFVLYPEQSPQMNPQRCWNWFKHNHQQRGRGEPALLAGMARSVMASHAIDPRRVYVAGLSAGGAMAAILGETYPELFAAVGVHSGLAAGSASNLPSALSAMHNGGMDYGQAATGMPTIVFHGDADATVNPVNGDQVINASTGDNATVEQQKRPAANASASSGGHPRSAEASTAAAAGRTSTRRVYRAANGQVMAEHWLVHGAPHAWAGGSSKGSYTDSRGPDATAEILRFFFEHPRVTTSKTGQ